MASGAEVMRERAIPELRRICRDARIFLSMPCLEEVTPAVLMSAERSEAYPTAEPLERRHGIFRANEVGLPAFDHGGLYGDGVFEGVLVVEGRLFTWREHLERFRRSAEQVGIAIPYGPVDLSLQVMKAVRETGLKAEERGYIRLVATRGLGDLGIHPGMCVGATVYAIAAKIQLYPEAFYRQGIGLALAREVRRPGQEVLDPNVKSCNYLNNIMGLVQTLDEGCLETMMLTQQGYVAEATADNIFLVVRGKGWEDDSGKVQVITPADAYGLRGITRGLVMDATRRMGYAVEVSGKMLPGDFTGPGREAFLTGTGAGMLPVVAVAGQPVGDGTPGPVTQKLREVLLKRMADPQMGLSVTATAAAVREYLDS